MKATEIKLAYKRKPTGLKIHSSNDAQQVLRKFWEQGTIDHFESFVVMYLSRCNEVLGIMKAAVGSIEACIVDVRKVYQGALLTNASAIIVSHNHPSGNLKPSQKDIELTKELRKAGELMKITLLDHVIVTSSGYFSFADEGIK